ncbi:hypothetical protein [Paraliobacillus sp. JSM ZJ581]|uniref:hypothetical protein n=1 Tax=Paraliobacillus sp. JSM ZJ581 TaxID=3342118 RepID=UPI0035A84094
MNGMIDGYKCFLILCNYFKEKALFNLSQFISYTKKEQMIAYGDIALEQLMNKIDLKP